MSSHAMVADRKSPREPAVAREPRAPRRLALVTERAASGPVRGASALGGEPRVSLLPPEVNDFHRNRAVRRRLVLGVLAVLVLVFVGVAGSYFLQVQAQAQLDASRATSADLLAQTAKYSELRKVQTSITLIEAGQQVGASTEVDWMTYLRKLQATLPAGVAINSVTIDSASPFVDYAQSSVPLQGSRIATLSFTASSPSIPSIPAWLDGLSTLVGFADAVPGSVEVQPDGSYIANITMHINSEAFSQRFAEKKK